MSENEQNIINKTYDPTKAPFNWDKLDELLAFKSSLIVCAEILECHENSIKNHIKLRHDQTFTQYSDRKLSRTKVKLVQKALEKAFAGDNCMLIFSLKNLCNWHDNVQHTVEGLPDITLSYKK